MNFDYLKTRYSSRNRVLTTPPQNTQPIPVGRKVQIQKTTKAPEVKVFDPPVNIQSSSSFGPMRMQPKIPESFTVKPRSFEMSKTNGVNLKGQSAFNEPKLSDFQIRVGNRTFYVSKMVLAANSEVFHRMFMTDCSEVDTGFMVMEGVDPAPVEAMLQYMFHKKSVDDDLAREVIILADKYQVPDLKTQCEIKLGSTLSLDVLEDRIALAYQLLCSNLLKKCLKFGAEHFDGF
ncbi:unnamed protein product [Bursaphelenchus xylophilus]|nr:unnamed protein product [Bursaphelenchus xylophilus]CAG9122522.1 unnamed protein product [Bursaphelenchus xylophilus]